MEPISKTDLIIKLHGTNTTHDSLSKSENIFSIFRIHVVTAQHGECKYPHYLWSCTSLWINTKILTEANKAQSANWARDCSKLKPKSPMMS